MPEDKRRLTVYLPAELYRRTRMVAAAGELSLSELVEGALRRCLDPPPPATSDEDDAQDEERRRAVGERRKPRERYGAEDLAEWATALVSHGERRRPGWPERRGLEP